jgi:hypothetical protein
MKYLALSLALLTFAVQAAENPDAALIAEQTKTYPVETCLVSGDKLGEMGKAYDYVYKETVDGKEKSTLIRLCCKSCVKTFKKDPAKYLKQLEEAKAKKSS